MRSAVLDRDRHCGRNGHTHPRVGIARPVVTGDEFHRGDGPVALRPCRLADAVAVETRTGRVIPADCDSGHCVVCGVTRARVRAAAITWCQRQQDRSRLITLTRCPDDWQTLRGQVRDLRQRIIDVRGRCEWIWTVERGAQTGMKHVHAIQHGTFIKQRELQKMWGDRIVDIRQVHDASKYISKSAALVSGYVGKGASDASGLATHLGLNGGRLHHWSRQFFCGKSIRDAIKLSRQSDADASWMVVHLGDDTPETVRDRATRAASARYVPDGTEHTHPHRSELIRKAWQ